MKQIDGKLDKLSGIGAYKGRTKTLAEKRQVQREVRERAKEWLREQESKLRKKLVAKYQDERKNIIKKSFAELEMKGGDFFYHETKRRKEKIAEMIDNNIKRRINVEIEKVKIQEWTPEVVLAKVTKEFKKATRDDRTLRNLEKNSKGMGKGVGKAATHSKKKLTDAERELSKVVLPALVVARKRGRRISQIKIDNARERELAVDQVHENTFGMDLTNHHKGNGKTIRKNYRGSSGAHTGQGVVHLMHKTRKPIKNSYQIKGPHVHSKAKEDIQYLSDGERARISDYLRLEGPLNTTPSLQKFPRLMQLTYLALPFCNLGYVGIKNLSEILHLCKSLKHLDLSGNDIDLEALQILLNSVENSREIPIHSLELSSNNIGSGSIEGIRAIISLIRSPRKNKIRVISLRANFLSHSAVAFLMGFLKENKSLKEINLAENGIQDKGAQLIADMLSTNKALEKLDVSYNDVGISGVKYIAQALEGNTMNNLKSLNISWNPLHDEGVSCVVNLLPASMIEDLHLDSTKCTDASCLALANCILKYGSNLRLQSLTIIQNKYFGPGGMNLESAATKYGIKLAKDASLAQLRNTDRGTTRFDRGKGLPALA